jgi:hypothetical protein
LNKFVDDNFATKCGGNHSPQLSPGGIQLSPKTSPQRSLTHPSSPRPNIQVLAVRRSSSDRTLLCDNTRSGGIVLGTGPRRGGSDRALKPASAKGMQVHTFAPRTLQPSEAARCAEAALSPRTTSTSGSRSSSTSSVNSSSNSSNSSTPSSKSASSSITEWLFGKKCDKKRQSKGSAPQSPATQPRSILRSRTSSLSLFEPSASETAAPTATEASPTSPTLARPAAQTIKRKVSFTDATTIIITDKK